MTSGHRSWVKELDDGPNPPVTFPGDDGNDRPGVDAGRAQSVLHVRDVADARDLYQRRGGRRRATEEILLNLPIWEPEWSRDGTWLVLSRGWAGDRHAMTSMPCVRASIRFRRVLLATRPMNTRRRSPPTGAGLPTSPTNRVSEEVYVRDPVPDADRFATMASQRERRHRTRWAHSGS